MSAKTLVTIGLLAFLTAAETVEPFAQTRLQSGTLRVAVNVSVRSGNAPVAGLQTSDFDVFDNGVRQAVDDVAFESVPIDVTLLIDTSGSILGALDRLKNDARDIARLLRPVDRLRLLTIDTYVHQAFPMQPSAGQPSWSGVTIGGTSSVHDGLMAALIFPVAVDRRHLVLAMTDGVDTISVNDAARVRDIASRSDALLHIAPVRGDAVPSAHRPWRPFRENNIGLLADVAESTGGAVHDEQRGRNSRVDAFKRVLDDFRQSYVLTYTLKGVRPTGWHDITVKVTRPGRYTVRARRGYFGR